MQCSAVNLTATTTLTSGCARGYHSRASPPPPRSLDRLACCPLVAGPPLASIYRHACSPARLLPVSLPPCLPVWRRDGPPHSPLALRWPLPRPRPVLAAELKSVSARGWNSLALIQQANIRGGLNQNTHRCSRYKRTRLVRQDNHTVFNIFSKRCVLSSTEELSSR